MDSDFEVIAQQLSIYQISLHDIQHKEKWTQQGTLQGFSSLSLKINTFSNQKKVWTCLSKERIVNVQSSSRQMTCKSDQLRFLWEKERTT